QQANKVLARVEGAQSEDERLWQAAGHPEGHNVLFWKKSVALLGRRVRDVHALLGHAQEAHDITSRVFGDREYAARATDRRPSSRGQINAIDRIECFGIAQEAEIVDGD